LRTPLYFGRIWPIRSQCHSHFGRNCGSSPRPQEGPSSVAPRIGSVGREGRQVWAATRAPSARAGQEVISRPLTAPAHNAKPKIAAARRAALARPLAGRMGAARPPSSAVGPPAAAAGRSTGVPDRLFGRSERLLRRPPRRRHAPAAAARLASAAPPAPSRRAARAAASSRRRAGRGAGSARPSGGRRAQSVHQSTGRPPHRLAPLRSDAGRVAPRRAARDSARRASATRRRWWWRAPCGALCAGRGWRSAQCGPPRAARSRVWSARSSGAWYGRAGQGPDGASTLEAEERSGRCGSGTADQARQQAQAPRRHSTCGVGASLVGGAGSILVLVLTTVCSLTCCKWVEGAG